MTISLVTRIQHTSLYERMIASALSTAYGKINALSELDTEHMPYCAQTYNRLFKRGESDIVCFVEDDVEFLSPDWDRIAEELFTEFDMDILGVVGSRVYNGGGYFDSGSDYSEGLICGNHEGETHVRIMGERKRYVPVRVIDGMLMFVRQSFFEKESFDEKNFDQLFYYDTDLCLRSGKVGVTSDILVKHSKPPEFYGKYPDAMKPVEAYDPILEDKHRLFRRPRGNQVCCMVSLDTFNREGQTACHRKFKEKWKIPVLA